MSKSGIAVEFVNNSSLKYLQSKRIKQTVMNVLIGEEIFNAEINIIALNDENIHVMNNEYLKHDYPTDVISFKIEEDPILGEVYIGVQTAEEQAKEYNVSLTNEMMRLAAHGTLHIIGYEDDTEQKKKVMHELENKYIEYKNV